MPRFYKKMRIHRAVVIFVAIFGIFIFGLPARAQSAFEEKKLNEEVNALLRIRDLTDVSNGMSRVNATSTGEILRSIIIFSRAGHKERVANAIRRLSSVPLPEQQYEDLFYIRKIVRGAIDPQDLASMRLFYEHFQPGGDDRTGEFIGLWQKVGNTKDLEAWLASRARGNESWWQRWYELRVSLGTADQLVDELAAEVRTHPGDWYRLEKYLRAGGGARDLAWLVEIVPTNLSYDAYELGSLIRPYNPGLAIQLLEKSLSLPFTDRDRTTFASRAFRMTSIAPKVSDPEKQLRYWTLKMLASTHNETGRPELAQPYAERLTAMDTADIQTGDTYGVAGAVQMSSGQRVVESRILQNETASRELPQYWLERAAYYRGRNEPELVLATFRQALGVFHYRQGDAENNLKRLWIFDALSRVDPRAQKTEIAQIFRSELELTRADPAQQFAIVRMLLYEFEDLIDAYYVNNSQLARILAARGRWGSDEHYVIEHVLERELWEPEKRTQLIKALSSLAQLNLKTRAFSLSKALTEDHAPHAVPLLEKLRAIAPNGESAGWDFDREEIDTVLFTAYLRSGKWRQAEKMVNENYSYWGNELGSIAIAAAAAGDVKEAVRVWTLNTNRDRRNLEGLDALSKTAARGLLRELYLTIKRRDPLSDIPDRALAIIN